MPTGVLLLNFGEPEEPGLEAVTTFLEAIFLANARLEPAGAATAEVESAARTRARELAARRAPSLVAEYGRIGGSPLVAQTRAQAEALEAELRRRGEDAVVVCGMQFTAPSIEDAVRAALDAGADSLVALPLYPVRGPSTTVPALAAARRAASDIAPGVPLREVAGWHRHPGYLSLRARTARSFCEAEDVDVADPRTRVFLSAHGTPLRYLRGGSRYDQDVADHARALAAALGVDRYVLGWQNHGSRPGVEWTEPAVELALADVARAGDADRVVVVPISFVNELSETLDELDIGLREEARQVGLGFHRVPVPWADPAFIGILADLVVRRPHSSPR